MKSGIYKITSPSGRYYVGQSVDLKRRESEYRSLFDKIKNQPKLYNSIVKYGWEAHHLDIIEYCSEEELNCSERFWQDIFDVLNGGLNCILQECGEKRRTYSKEMREKISARTKGENNPMFGVVRPKEWGENHSIFLKEMFSHPDYVHPSKGSKMSDKQKKILLDSNLGRKASDQTRQKMSESRKGRVISEEGRKNISNGKLKEKNPMFGKFGKDNPGSKVIINTLTGELTHGISELSRNIEMKRETLRDCLLGLKNNSTPYMFLEVVNDFENYFYVKQKEAISKFSEIELNILRNNDSSFLIENHNKLYQKYKKYNPDNKFFPREKWTEELVIEEMKNYKNMAELRKNNDPLSQVIRKRFKHLKNFYNLINKLAQTK